MKGGVILAGLSVVIASCALPQHDDLASSVQPADIAYRRCLQKRHGYAVTCKRLRLPDPTSTTAYGMCLQYHRVEPKACNDLRLAYENELRAYLSSPEPTANAPTSPTTRPPLTRRRARELYQTAEALFQATNSDAQTFTAALLIPDIRQKMEGALRKRLSDQQLHKLADQARAEALYWYEYMRGLERGSTAP